MKKFLILLLSSLMLASVLACAAPDAPAEDGDTTPIESDNVAPAPGNDSGVIDWDTFEPTGVVVEWNWNSEHLEHSAALFAERFPTATFEPMVVAHGDILPLLLTALAAGGDTPDILLGEAAFRGSLFELGIFEDLEAAPFSFDTGTIIPSVLPQLRDHDGRFVGFDQQFSPMGLKYRRDVMYRYFGVSEPDEVAELFATWNDVIELGQQLAALETDVVMFSGLQELTEIIYRQHMAPGWTHLDTQTIDLTDRVMPALQLAYEVASQIPIGNLTVGSTEWHASYATGEVLFYPLTSWTSRGRVAGNFPESRGEGLWGAVKAPGDRTGFMGGTLIGVPTVSENRYSAFAFIRWLYATDEGAQGMFERLGFIPSINSFYVGADAPILAGGFFDDFYDDQNIALYMFEVIAPLARSDPFDSLQVEVLAAFNSVMTEAMADTSIDANRAFELMVEALTRGIPGVTIN